MRRSICYTEPSYALAGQVTTWRFAFASASQLSAGAKLKFDLLSNGREIDWQIPTADLKKKENLIYGLMPDGELVQAIEIEHPETFVPQFEFTLPDDLPAGEEFSVMMGAYPDKEGELDPESGNGCQTNVQRRRPFYLYVDPKGQGHYDDPQVFSLDIRGNRLHRIRVLTPSFVLRNKRFDVTVRFEDEFGNLTANADPETLIELTYEQLRENLNWKLFVPETGFITLPNLYFNEPGIYTILLKNMHEGTTFKSSPIRCFMENSSQLFWGLLHGESDRVDSTENVEACLRHFRDDTAMNYFAYSGFEGQDETPTDIWKLASQNVADFNEDDRFTTFLGFQWVGDTKKEGVRQFIYPKDSKPLLRKKEVRNSSLKKIYKYLPPKECISIPSFTMGDTCGFNFEDWNPSFERVVEIYNAWGSSECLEKDGNDRAITKEGKQGISEWKEGSIRQALSKGCRFGFVAGGLDDRGIYSSLYDSDQVQYNPGMTGIIAEGHSRAQMYEALYNRSCYATTGKRIIVGIELAGICMGQEVTTGDKPGLKVNRHISGYVAGTTHLETIEIIRNGEVIHTIDPEGYFLDFTYDDMEPLSELCLNGRDGEPPFVYYYIRVTQKDGHMAWGSPIWVVDSSEVSAPKKPGRRGRPKGS